MAQDDMHVEVVVDEATCRTVLTAWKPTVEEDDMLTSDDIATAVWHYGIRNGFGDTVQARQIVTAGEKRTADPQQAFAALAGQIAKLRSGGIDAAAITHAVGDAVAARP